MTDSSSSKIERKPLVRQLTAIGFADVAGFTRLVARDEAGTIRRWERLRREVIDPLTLRYGGTTSEFAGDAVLVVFSSVASAVNWALAVQEETARHEPAGAADSLRMRIGVNVDDVVVDGPHVLGDGVIVAARIHQAASPGQVVVTSLVRELMGSRPGVRFTDLGTPRLKNVERVVHLYAVEPSDGRGVPAAGHPYLEWTARPALAVLPFVNVSDGGRADYFTGGLTEDIIAGLSRSRSFNVIAHATMQRYADHARDLRDIADELGVTYVLDGSVRRRGETLRISAELIHVEQRVSIWTDRFEGATGDLFDLQDHIVAGIIGVVGSRLQAAEVDRVRSRPTSSLDAYDSILKAASLLYEMTDDSYRDSGLAVERALALDPCYAQAWAWGAWRLNFLYGEARSGQPQEDRLRALAMAQRAMALDPDDPFVLTVAAHLTSFVDGRPRDGAALFEQALRLDPCCARAWAYSAITMTYLGRVDEAMQQFDNAFRLSPFDRENFSWWSGAGKAEFVAGRYERAAELLRKARLANPRFIATLRFLAPALAHLGEIEEAKRIARELLALEPGFSAERFVAGYPLQRPDDREALRRGLLDAGLPA